MNMSGHTKTTRNTLVKKVYSTLAQYMQFFLFIYTYVLTPLLSTTNATLYVGVRWVQVTFSSFSLFAAGRQHTRTVMASGVIISI